MSSRGFSWPTLPRRSPAIVMYAGTPYLQPHLRMDSYRQFRTELDKIRKQGYAVDYKVEVSTIMRVVVPVHLPDDKELRFAIGIVANFVYLLQVKSCLRILRATAQEVAGVLKGNVPDFRSDKGPRGVSMHGWYAPSKRLKQPPCFALLPEHATPGVAEHLHRGRGADWPLVAISSSGNHASM